MYVTAHQVRNRDDERGINSFLHRHDESFAWPLDVEAQARIPDEAPGETVDSRLVLKPGGNSVEAFLDVVAREDTPDPQVLRALDEFRRTTTRESLPRVAVIEGVVLRFGLNLGLYGDFRRLLDRLCTSVEALLASNPRSPR